MSRARRPGALVTVVFAVFSVTGFDAPAAGSVTRYAMVASADTATYEVLSANAPLLAPQVLLVSGGTAQAQLDSFGGSIAFAGSPFLGQTMSGIGGLVNGLGAGGLPELPPQLPGYVTTSSPSNPEQDSSQGPYTLRAESTPNRSAAIAGIGVAGTNLNALVSQASAEATAAEDGELKAMARALTEPIGIGSLLRLGTVEGSATMTVDSSGEVTQSSSFRLGTTTVAGIEIGVVDGELRVAGTPLLGLDFGDVEALLAPAGIELKVLPAEKTATTLVSQGLRITFTRDIAVQGVSGVRVILGRAAVRLESGGNVTSDGSDGSLQTPELSGTPVPIEAPALGNVPSVPASGSIDLPPLLQAAPVRPGGPTAPPANVANLEAALGPDGLRWYLMLVMSALVLLGASRAVSFFSTERH